MGRKPDAFDPPSNIPWIGLSQDVLHAGMSGVRRPVNRLDFRPPVRLPHFINMQNSKHDALGVSEGDGAASANRLGKLFRYVQNDRDRP